jgi:NAD(P)-dependent dehydrogenase (short-subunit alcohol dehydrogenase family)
VPPGSDQGWAVHAKLPFVLKEFRLRSFSIFDVGIASQPPDDVAFSVEFWEHTYQEPSVFSVISPDAGFQFALFGIIQQSKPFPKESIQVIGVNDHLQPQPFPCSGVRPVYSYQRLLRNSLDPSGKLVHKKDGTVSIRLWSRAASPRSFSRASLCSIKRFGRLDVAVNNAGTEGTPGPVTEQTAETYAATFDTNVLGTLLSMKHELRVMLAQGSGSIVNLSSAYGSVGAAGASVYVASKHAVEGLTKSAALEVAGTGVRVNVVAPGTTDTGMLTRFSRTDENKAALVSTVPVKRMATSEEIAHVIAFVASENASYMTGSSIPVDGGMIAG